MNRFLSTVSLLLCSINHACADAPLSACTTAQALDIRQQLVYFTQQPFEDGAQELAIIALTAQLAPTIKRITYHQNTSAHCHFPAIAITRAGDWGWFLAWAFSDKAYYARMDSEALVFSPPKLLPIAQVAKIEFLADSPQPTMRVEMQNGTTQLLSTDDEGRHWQVAP